MSMAAADFAGPLAKGAILARFLVGAVLVLAGLSKLMVPAEEFAMALEAYRLFPLPVIMVIAKVIPWIELLTGAFLLLGYGLTYAGSVAFLFFAAFIAALGSTLFRGIAMDDCGCFGWGIPHFSPSTTILMDSVLLVLCLIILLDKKRLFSLERRLRKRR